MNIIACIKEQTRHILGRLKSDNNLIYEQFLYSLMVSSGMVGLCICEAILHITTLNTDGGAASAVWRCIDLVLMQVVAVVMLYKSIINVNMFSVRICLMGSVYIVGVCILSVFINWTFAVNAAVGCIFTYLCLGCYKEVRKRKIQNPCSDIQVCESTMYATLLVGLSVHPGFLVIGLLPPVLLSFEVSVSIQNVIKCSLPLVLAIVQVVTAVIIIFQTILVGSKADWVLLLVLIVCCHYDIQLARAHRNKGSHVVDDEYISV